MEKIQNIVVLGATGSIGQQTLDVVRQHKDKLIIAGLVAYSSEEKLTKLAQEFAVENAFLINSFNSEDEATARINEMITAPNVDIVVNAMSGAAGLEASYMTLQAGKRLALANKESLVVGGELIMPLAKKLAKETGELKLLPIDSEHGAIFQCLIGENIEDVYKLHITASGGPFFGKKESELKHVTKADALNHPTWNMGPKITIDSSTLMNKGLEVIEAHHLFDIDYSQINVVVQRQSAIHSMVEFIDGSVKAHLGTTDMRIPIQYALSYPERWNTPVERMDFQNLVNLEFDKPDCETFKCLHLAFQAGKMGGIIPCVMNAANEIAVAKFLNDEIGFLGIADTVEKTMNNFINKNSKVESLEQIKDFDTEARKFAMSIINH